MRVRTRIKAGGNGVPNQGTEKIFEPLSGSLVVRKTYSSHGDLSRTDWNSLRAAAVNAGGMSDVPAAYAAIKSAWDALESGRGGWLDRMTTGTNGTETALLRAGEVWSFVGQGEIPSPPQP